MKVIIQCAASKRADAGTLITRSGEAVSFVAAPDCCHLSQNDARFARPDDNSDETGLTWRDVLVRYNEDAKNPYDLCKAADLYMPSKHEFRKLYRELAQTFGWENFFIFSAGWGLIRSDYLTPNYNVTFSKDSRRNKPWAWRNSRDGTSNWLDFNHLKNVQIAQDEPIHFFGGKDYRELFYTLSECVPGKMTIHYKYNENQKDKAESRPYCEHEPYCGDEGKRTWHYRAAKEFMAKKRSP